MHFPLGTTGTTGITEFFNLTNIEILGSSGIQHRSLSVEMSRSYSIAECENDIESAPPLYGSCREIIDTMPWSTNPVTFGLPWQVQ